MNEDKNNEIKTKKEKKKDERRQVKSYLKAQYNYRIGYFFKAIRTYLKKNTVYLIKRNIKALTVILLALSILFVLIGISQIIAGNKKAHKIEDVQHSIQNLKTQAASVDADLKREQKKIDSVSVSTQSGVVRGKKTIDKVFTGMYEYQNADEYKANREAALKYFDDPKAKWVNSVYSDDKDEDGNSQIETLGLTSELDSTDVYTESVEDTEEKVVPFKVIAAYTGKIDDVSSDYATRTHYTVYEVDLDTSNNKITKMKKISTVEENNSIS